jgi:hypothetical protein
VPGQRLALGLGVEAQATRQGGGGGQHLGGGEVLGQQVGGAAQRAARQGGEGAKRGFQRVQQFADTFQLGGQAKVKGWRFQQTGFRRFPGKHNEVPARLPTSGLAPGGHQKRSRIKILK